MVIAFWGFVAVAIAGSLVWGKVRTRRRLAALAAHEVPTAAEIAAATQGRRRSSSEIESRAAMGNVPYQGMTGGPII